MNMQKPSLYDISWQVDEATYREDRALSYSTLSRFERDGFSKLDKLFDKIESPSLTFGSAVDAIITGGEDEFNKDFIVAEFPPMSDNLQAIAKDLFNTYGQTYRSISEISDDTLAAVGSSHDFYANDKYKNYRVKLIKEGCQEYYNIMYAAQGKAIINSETMQKVQNVVRALKDSEATRWYFAADSPFDNIERFYQLKFKATLEGVDYRCMADLIIVDHDNKTIYPIDLKTTGHPEWEFAGSFVKWNYQIQARLYWKIIRDNLDRHPMFKDYKLENYRFIVINKDTITPLVWEFKRTQHEGDLRTGKNAQIIMKDPIQLGRELAHYLESRPRVPEYIHLNDCNPLENELAKL